MEQCIIQNIRNRKDLISTPCKNNAYEFFKVAEHSKVRLDFRKSFENREQLGYHHLELSISPHYYFNNYQHNGNDFSFHDCKECIFQLLTHLEIFSTEYHLLKVVNIEFGVNIHPSYLGYTIENLINSIYYYKKTPFIKNINKHGGDYFKITHATSYKQIKVYAKGLHFVNYPEYNLNRDLLRFEVKSKQAKNIKNYEIYDASDLFKSNTYKNLSEHLVKEWNSVLVIDQNFKLSQFTLKERKFLKTHLSMEQWQKIINSKSRNAYSRDCKKYNEILRKRFSIKEYILKMISNKVSELKIGANSIKKNENKKKAVSTFKRDSSSTLQEQKRCKFHLTRT